MIQDEQLQDILVRYQGYPLFDSCTVESANALAVDGESILHKAVMMKDVLGVKVLLDNAADPNQIGNMGDTPLHQAAFNNNLAIVEILVRNGADVNAKNEFGETPADLAKTHKSQALINYLTQH
jgi:ankyrin repeat protein